MKNYSIYIMAQPGTTIDGYHDGMYCKVGFSDNPSKRIIQVDTQVKSVFLVAEYEFRKNSESEEKSRDYIMQSEKMLHKLLQHYHVKKEWFYLGKKHIILLDDLIVNFFDVTPHYHDKDFLKPKEFKNIKEKIESCIIDFSKKYYFKRI
jgi:hypothetical protein